MVPISSEKIRQVLRQYTERYKELPDSIVVLIDRMIV